jgi:hypothetical protein
MNRIKSSHARPRALLTRLPDIIDIWYYSGMDRFYCDGCLACGNGFNVSSHPVVRFTIPTTLQNSHCGRTIPMDRIVCSTKTDDTCVLESVARYVSLKRYAQEAIG